MRQKAEELANKLGKEQYVATDKDLTVGKKGKHCL